MRTKTSPTGSIDHPIDPITFALGSGATFVARTIDVDANHMQETLKRAHAHKGTSFVEILQNCPVFNDDIWKEVENKKSRTDSALVLEHGKPLVFGSPGQLKGIVIDEGVPSIVSLAAGEDPVERGVVLHDEGAGTARSFVLASLHRPEFPLPVGVLRETSKPCYEDMLANEVKQAIEKRGKGNLEALLRSGDTWTVEG
jgi:2-oxoglutarate ferredoxin oxidoreductase subunit beta